MVEIASIGRVVSVTTWVLLAMSTISVIARVGIKYSISKRCGLDDVLVVLALILSIGSGVAVSILDANGLGLSEEDIEVHQIVKFSKALYAANVILVLSLGFAKMSVVVLIRQIAVSPIARKINLGIGYLTLISTFVSVVVQVFECRFPRAWDLSQTNCIDRTAFWYFFGVIQFVCDYLLISLPLIVLLRLDTTLGKKLAATFGFGIRMGGIITMAVLMKLSDRLRSNDLTVDLWPWLATAQIVQYMTLISACTPYLKPLLQLYPSVKLHGSESAGTVTTAPHAVDMHQDDESLYM